MRSLDSLYYKYSGINCAQTNKAQPNTRLPFGLDLHGSSAGQLTLALPRRARARGWPLRHGCRFGGLAVLCGDEVWSWTDGRGHPLALESANGAAVVWREQRRCVPGAGGQVLGAPGGSAACWPFRGLRLDPGVLQEGLGGGPLVRVLAQRLFEEGLGLLREVLGQEGLRLEDADVRRLPAREKV